MSRRNRERRHLHVVPDTGPAAGRGSQSGRSARRDVGRDRGVPAMTGLRPSDGRPTPLAARRAEPEPDPAGPELSVDDILDQLAGCGLPPELLDEGLALSGEHHAELAGLLRAAAAMLSGDPVAGLLGIWQPLLDPRLTVFDAELAAAEILWSFHGAVGDDDLADGLSRLVEEAAPTGRPEALVMCRMLHHLGPPDVRTLTGRVAADLAAGGIKDRPWVADLGTAGFRRAYGFVDGPTRAFVAEFAYGRRPHAFVVVVDELAGGLTGLYATEDVDALAGQMCLDAAATPGGLAEMSAADLAGRLRRALDLPLWAEIEDDEAQMESLVPIVRERVGRLAGAGAAPVPRVRSALGPVPGVATLPVPRGR